MRSFAFAAIVLFAFPVVTLLTLASRNLDNVRHKPEAASIVFTSSSARQWLNEETGPYIHAVLRAEERREPNR